MNFKNIPLFIFSLSLLSSTLCGYQFGKNKVIYNKADWEIYKTPHFDIYHSTNLRNVAEKAGKIAEDASAKLSQVYQQPLLSIIPIVIYDNTVSFANTTIINEPLSEFTGGFTEILRNRVVIPFNGRYDDFRHVLVHELNHAFQFNVLFKGDEGLSLGKLSAKFPPLWMMEGLAEYYSLGMNYEGEKYARDGIITGFYPTLLELEDLYSLGYKGFYVYKGGQAFISWVEEKYGEQKVADLFHRMCRDNNSEIVFKELFKKDFESVNREWFIDMKKKYFPSIEIMEEPDLRDIRLTQHFEDESSFNFRPVFDKNNNYLYFITDKNIYPKIVRFNRKQGRIDKTIASSEQSYYLESINVLNNSLSTDLKREHLLFSSRSGNTYYLNLYSIKRNKILFHTKVPWQMVYSSALSPDGKFAVVAAQEKEQSDLYLLHIENGSFEKITDDLYTEEEPTWSPDGTQIAYSGNKKFSIYSSSRSIFLYDFKNKSNTIFTISKGRDTSPAFSPDGTKLAFVSDRAGSANLYVKDLETLILHQITSLYGSAEQPAWSADNTQVAYTTFNKGGHDIFITTLQLDRPGYSKTNYIEEIDKGKDASEKNKIMLSEVASASNRYDQFPDINVIEKNAPYKRYLYPDFFMFSLSGGSGYGFGGQLYASLSDMLSEKQIFLNSYLNYFSEGKTLDSDSLISYIDFENRLNTALSLYFYQFNHRFLKKGVTRITSLKDFESYYDRKLGISAGVLYPYSRYSRFEANFTPMWIERNLEGISNPEIILENPAISKYALIFNSGFTYDSTLMGYLHPVDNQRARISLEGSPPIPGLLSYLKFFFDGRNYLMLNKKMSLAGRIMGGAVFGADKQEFRFRIGGDAVDPNFPNIRGYRFYSQEGSYMLLANVEFRTRVLEYATFAFPFPFTISGINGLLFADAGSAFDSPKNYSFGRQVGSKYRFEDLSTSIGMGLRFVFFIFPIKLDFAIPLEGLGYQIPSAKKWKTSFWIGLDF